MVYTRNIKETYNFSHVTWVSFSFLGDSGKDRETVVATYIECSIRDYCYKKLASYITEYLDEGYGFFAFVCACVDWRKGEGGGEGREGGREREELGVGGREQ